MNKTEQIFKRMMQISWAFSWRLALINFLAVIITISFAVLCVKLLGIPRDIMKIYAKVVGFVLPFFVSICMTIIILKKRYSNFSISLLSHADSEIQALSWNRIVTIWWSTYWRFFVYVMICTACVIAFVILIAFIFNPGTGFVTLLIPVLLIPLILVVIYLVYKRILNLKYPDTQI